MAVPGEGPVSQQVRQTSWSSNSLNPSCFLPCSPSSVAAVGTPGVEGSLQNHAPSGPSPRPSTSAGVSASGSYSPREGDMLDLGQFDKSWCDFPWNLNRAGALGTVGPPRGSGTGGLGRLRPGQFPLAGCAPRL